MHPIAGSNNRVRRTTSRSARAAAVLVPRGTDPARRRWAVPAALAALALLATLLSPAAGASSDSLHPTGLSAQLADGTVTLNWSAPADDAEGVTGYQVLRRRPGVDAVGTFHIIAEDTAATGTSFEDPCADQASTKYTYRVKARRGDDLSRWSNYSRVDLPAGFVAAEPRSDCDPDTGAPAPDTGAPDPDPVPDPVPDPDPVPSSSTVVDSQVDTTPPPVVTVPDPDPVPSSSTVVDSQVDTTPPPVVTVPDPDPDPVPGSSTEAFEWVVLPGVKELAEGNSSPRAVWSDGTTLWVSNRGDRVYAYDFASMSRDAAKDITAIEAAGNHHASGLWSDGATMWVSDEDDGKVYAYDLATGARVPGSDIDTKDEAGNAKPKGIWSDGETMWVGDYDDFHVYAYDLDTGERVAIDYVSLLGSGTCYCRDIEELPYEHNHHPVGLWSDGATMWVSDSADDKVYAYGLTDYTNDPRYEDSEFNSLRAAGNADPEGMWSDGAVLWVVDSKDNLLYGYNMPATVSLGSLELTDADFGVFHPSILRYAARVPTTVTEVTITAEAADTDTTVAISPSTDADPDTDGHQIVLSAGANTITVTATKGTDTRTYTITIISGDVVAVAGEAVAGEGESVAVVADAVDTVLQVSSVGSFVWNSDRDISVVGTSGSANPSGVWSDGTTVWVSDDGDDKIYAYDLATGERASDSDIDALKGAGNRRPAGLWSDGTTMWVVDGMDEMVYAYDLATGARKGTDDFYSWTLGDADNLSPKGLWSDGATMWVTDLWDGKVYAYDLAAKSRRPSKDLDTLKSAGNSRPAGLWSDGTIMWVTDDADDKVYAYDLATGARRSYLDFGTLSDAGNNAPAGLWSDDTHIWVADEHDGKLYAYAMPGRTNLQSLELDGTGLEAIDPSAEAFDPSVADYTVRAPSTMTMTTVTASALYADAVVVVSPADEDPNTDGDQISLTAGDNTITVTVTRGSHTKTYTVVVNKTGLAVIRNDATLSALTLSDVDIGTFDAATARYTTGVASSVATTTVTANSTDTGATVTISPGDADADTEGHQVDLEEGANTVTVAVESHDTTVNKTYTVVVARGSAEPFGWAVTSDISELAAGNRTARATWSDGTTMWVTDLSGALFAYDLASGAHDSSKDITTLAAAGNRNANGLWSDGTTIWVSDDRDEKLYAYSLATGARDTSKEFYTGRDDRTLPIAQRIAGWNWTPKGLWSDGTTIWVSDPKNDTKIFAYDLATGEMDTSKEIASLCAIWSHHPRAADNCHPAALWSDGTTMWVVDNQDQKLYAYDLDTGEPQAHLDFNTLSDAGNLSPKGLWSDGTTMWVTDSQSQRIYSYNMPGQGDTN